MKGDISFKPPQSVRGYFSSYSFLLLHTRKSAVLFLLCIIQFPVIIDPIYFFFLFCDKKYFQSYNNLLLNVKPL